MAGRSTNDPGNYIALGKQPARDQAATGFYFLKHLSGSLLDPDPEIQREREGGAGQEVSLSYRSQVKADPALVAYDRPEWAAHSFGAILADASQTIIATGAAPGDWLVRHTFIPTTFNAYFEVEQLAGETLERVTNCKANQLEIEFEAGRPLKRTLSFISGGSYGELPIASAQTPVRESGKPMFYPGASVVITGATAAQITKGKVTAQRDIDGDIYTTGLNRSDVVEQNQDYLLEGTIKYEDPNLWRRAHYNGGSQVSLNLATVGLDIFIPAPVGSHSERIRQPVLEVQALKLNRLDPDGKTMYYDLSAAHIRHATHAMIADVVTGATAPY